MTRIQNILVGVDLRHGDRLASPELGEESQAAVAESLRLAATWGGTVTFCSVLELSAQSQSLIEHDVENIFKTVEDVASEVLSELVANANSQGIACESMIRFGAAWEELSKESATGDYDLVIVGTRSKIRATQMLFGTTAQKLMRCSACPVWIVKPAELRDVRDVAVATDLSPASLPALSTAVTVARAIGARLHVLHVVELSDFQDLVLAGVSQEVLVRTEARLRQSAEDTLRDQLHRTDFRTLPHGVKIELLSGIPETAIPEYIACQKVDLLVMGTHGHSGMSGLLIGNTAERILPALHASLLVVKPSEFRSPYAKTSTFDCLTRGHVQAVIRVRLPSEPPSLLHWLRLTSDPLAAGRGSNEIATTQCEQNHLARPTERAFRWLARTARGPERRKCPLITPASLSIDRPLARRTASEASPSSFDEPVQIRFPTD